MDPPLTTSAPLREELEEGEILEIEIEDSEEEDGYNPESESGQEPEKNEMLESGIEVIEVIDDDEMEEPEENDVSKSKIAEPEVIDLLDDEMEEPKEGGLLGRKSEGPDDERIPSDEKGIPEGDTPSCKQEEPDEGHCPGDQDEVPEGDVSAEKKEEVEDDEISERNRAGQVQQQTRGSNIGNNPETICEDLQLVYRVLDISENSQRELAKLEITVLNKLLSKQAALHEGSLKPVTQIAQESLSNFCLWLANFYESHPCGSAWQEHFNEVTFLEYKQRSANMVSRFGSGGMASAEVQKLYEYMVEKLHYGCDFELAKISDERLEEVYEYGAERVVATLSPEMRKQCQFCYREYTLLFLREIFGVNDDNSDLKKALLVMGKTQSGKTTVIALMAKICEQLHVPLYVLTKGVQESKDLRIKLDKMLETGQSEIVAFLKAQSRNRSPVLTVAADTANQIQNTIKNIDALRNGTNLSQAKFVLIVDECDAMYRTSSRKQKMEQAFDKLMSYRPAVRLEVSATPIPAMLSLDDMDVKMLQIGTHTKEYSGVEDMKPLQDDEGNDIYLEHTRCAYQLGVEYSHVDGNLNVNDETSIFRRDMNGISDLECCRGLNDFPDLDYKFPKCDGYDYIPYSDEKQMMLYDDAMSGKNGVLLLDSTASRVSVKQNIFDKAACVQNYYRQRGKDMVAIVNIGRGIYVRRPGFLQGRFTKKTISEVIASLDSEYTLSMPIFVFGYTKMRRCVSYRSTSRVPTHMVLMLGIGYSIESFIQAIGRATFNGLNSVLNANGHQHVIVLVSYDDFLSAKKYVKWVEEVIKRQKMGYSMSEAIQGGGEKFPDEVNWFRHTNRKCGQDKNNKRKLPSDDAFHAPTLDELKPQLKEKACRYERDPKALKVIKSIWHFFSEDVGQNGDPPTCFSVNDIRTKYNDTFYGREAEPAISSAEIRKILTMLKNDVIIEKMTNFDFWKPKSWPVLEKMAQLTRA